MGCQVVGADGDYNALRLRDEGCFVADISNSRDVLYISYVVVYEVHELLAPFFMARYYVFFWA